MKHRVEISSKNGYAYFHFQPFTSLTTCGEFDCGIPEYNDYLYRDALRSLDEGVLTFYEKNGFIPNAELYNKNRKTISMRKDLYQ